MPAASHIYFSKTGVALIGLLDIKRVVVMTTARPAEFIPTQSESFSPSSTKSVNYAPSIAFCNI